MVDRHYKKVLVATMRITTNTTPETDTLGGQSEYWLNHLVVVIAAGKRPASIPNLEAKPASADGTAPGRVWESRTPPQQPSMVGPGTQTVPGPTTFTYSRKTAKGRASLETRKTASTAAPFLRMDLLLQPARVNPCPFVSEQHAYARNTATLESPRLACNGTTSTQQCPHTLNTLARALRFCFLCS